MTVENLTSLAHAGLAGIAVYGIFKGYQLLNVHITLPPPINSMQERDSKRRFYSIAMFLFVACLMALSAGVLELMKRDSKHELIINMSPYKLIPENLKPTVSISAVEKQLATNGFASIPISNKDSLHIDLENLVNELDDFRKNHVTLNKQIQASSNQELGYDNPNN